MKYTKQQLVNLETIEQAWDGSELKIDNGDHRIWLTQPENREYDGDYVVETKANGKWEAIVCYFDVVCLVG
jgi:hypothetical protein